MSAQKPYQHVDEMRQELARLREINAELLAAAKNARKHVHRLIMFHNEGCDFHLDELDAAIAHAEGWIP